MSVRHIPKCSLRLLFLTAACEESPGSNVAENAAGPRYGAEQVRVTSELIYPSATADSARLVSLWDVVEARDGSILVSDPVAGNVKLYSREGTLVRLIGRAGQGPGELSTSPPGMTGWMPILFKAPDTVFVVDPPRGVIHRFSLRGESRGTLPDPETGIIYYVGAGGHVYSARRERVVSDNPTLGDTIVTISRLDTAGTVPIATLHVPGVAARTWSVLYATEARLAALPDGTIAVGSGHAAEFAEYSPAFELIRTVRRPWSEQAIPVADYKPILQHITHSGALPAVPDDMIDSMVEGAKQAKGFASSYPAYVTIRSSPDGRIWLQRPMTREQIARGGAVGFSITGLGSTIWDVFTSDGEYLAEVSFPSGVEIRAFGKGIAYGVRQDDKGEMGIERFRVQVGER
jgi:hypothetical protein